MSKARHARPRRSTRRIVRTLSIAGLGAGLTATGAGAAFAADYTVKSGDTLSEIAQANGTDWHQLAELNGLDNPDLILIGQTLKLDGVKKAAVTERRSTAKSPRIERKTERKVERKTERKAETKSERSTRTSRSESNRSANSGSVSMSAAWRKVAQCESGGNPRAVNPSGKYHGLFQFDRQTWRSVGGSGLPSNASAAEQLMRAKKLYSQRGASPWPSCGRYLR